MNTNINTEVMNAFHTNVRVYCRRLGVAEFASYFIEDKVARPAIIKLANGFGYDLTNKDHLGRTAAFTVAVIIKLKAMQEATPETVIMMGKDECTKVASVAINIFHSINKSFNEEGNMENIKKASTTFAGDLLVKGVCYSSETYKVAEELVDLYFTNRKKEKSSVAANVLDQARNSADWE
jgi:hypothetical protein